jgi:uncharacterized protein YdaU (DUF1376 family)
MARNKTDIWMPLYIGDYLSDTQHLNTQQHGAYLLLMMAYWKSGPLPDDEEQLSAIAKLTGDSWIKAWGVLQPFFPVNGDGRRHNKRCDQERDKSHRIVGVRSEAGSSGAVHKWGEPTDKQKRSERLANARRLASHSPEDWQALIEVCGAACCRCKRDDVELVKDHIKPIYQGGSDGIENLQPLCRRCNSSKGPDTTDLRPPDWQELLLAKRLANAQQTPRPSPSHKELWFLPQELVLFKEDWNQFEVMRKKIRKPMTDQARKNICNKLLRFQASGHDAGMILQQSITNSWQDVFEVRGTRNAKPDVLEQIRQAREAGELV